MMKKCRLCGKELPASMFGKSSTTKDGLQSWCKSCQHEWSEKQATFKEIGVKVCRKCRQIKPKTEFDKCAGHKDGLQTYCKACASVHSRPTNEAPGTNKSEAPANDEDRYTRAESQAFRAGYQRAYMEMSFFVDTLYQMQIDEHTAFHKIINKITRQEKGIPT